jgi:hypothetical protein
MEWIKGVQELVPWLTSLRATPKAIISLLIIGLALFILLLIWTSPQDTAELPEAVSWLTALPAAPKVIISLLISGAALFILLLIWTPPPETAITTILSDCYRRALFTRMHAQLSTDAMFASIGKCREALQRNIPQIRRGDLRQTAVELLATIEQIERRNPIQSDDDLNAINLLKLSALRAFRQLAAATGGSYSLPDSGKLAEAAYFTQSEADAAPALDELSNQHTIDPMTGKIVPRG